MGDIGDESIDIITAFDVIEHIYDLPSLLKEFSNKLEVGGRLIVLTGDSNSISSKLAKNNWWYVCYPEYVIFPSLKYFRNHTNFKFINVINTYASIGYETSMYSKIKVLKRLIFKKRYNGLPSISGDHYLLICEKK